MKTNLNVIFAQALDNIQMNSTPTQISKFYIIRQWTYCIGSDSLTGNKTNRIDKLHEEIKTPK